MGGVFERKGYDGKALDLDEGQSEENTLYLASAVDVHDSG
jgi:hypothetical protein